MLRAPALLVSVFVITLLAALPLAITMRGMIEAHLGRSLRSEQVADGADPDWWQEFAFQASGIGTTFTPSVIGFATTLDSISGVLDGRKPQVEVAGALAVYLLAWIFLSGGIIDRYARQRPTHAHGFFAAAGVFFWRFLRLGVIAGVLYGWLFGWVHPWLFGAFYTRMTRDVAVESDAFMWRVALYIFFGAIVIAINLVVDYAKVRLVVEDRRSVVGALAASIGFMTRRPGRVWALYGVNAATFLVVIAIWALLAPGAGSAGLLMWLAFGFTQLYVLARLVLKLQFLASETAIFQASLAHAEYTAVPELVWPESPAAETIRS